MRRALAKSLGAVEERFVISVKTDNAGTSADNEFTIPTSTTGITQAFLYDIETSDGQNITGVTGNHTITFPSAGTYEVKISGSFPYMYFNNGGDKSKILDIKNFGIYALGSTSQINAFYGCSNLAINATDIGHFDNVTNFTRAWASCSSLTSFPKINTSSGTNFYVAWERCTNLTSFPLIDTSNGTNFAYTWGYSSLDSFPLLDMSSAVDVYGAWQSSNIVSFPAINFNNVQRFSRFNAGAWSNSNNLSNFPPNLFDFASANDYASAFSNTNLTTQSIDNILVSLDTSGVSNGTFTQSGGQAPSATGIAAKDSLVAKGWTITYTA